MKVRVGFVSNSSSSSFIIRAQAQFMSVRDVAKYIMGEASSAGYYEYFEELKNLNNTSNPDTPVFFNTGGDDTYIRKVDDKIVITTTQNISFDMLYPYALKNYDLTEEFYRKFDFVEKDSIYGDEEHTFDDPRDFDHYYAKFDDFLVLQHNFYGRHDYINNCPKCGKGFSRGWIIKGNEHVFCMCEIDSIIKKQQRKEKLIKINED